MLAFLLSRGDDEAAGDAAQAHRSLRYMLPASERNLYAEPKRLAAAGLVAVIGRGTRT